jgi:hypothetical protein
VAYVIGFAVMAAVLGWHPDAEHKATVAPVPAAAVVVPH